jgi:hypothetical protein
MVTRRPSCLDTTDFGYLSLKWRYLDLRCTCIDSWRSDILIHLQGINQARVIVLKPAFAVPPPDEEDYERVSDCFITAPLTVELDYFWGWWPATNRYGVNRLFPENSLDQAFQRDVRINPDGSTISLSSSWGFPLHDACLQIFKCVSTLRLGAVDLQGFFALWEVSQTWRKDHETGSTDSIWNRQRQSCAECGFQNLEQDPVIRACRDPYFSWIHKPGTEVSSLKVNNIPVLAWKPQMTSCSTLSLILSRSRISN